MKTFFSNLYNRLPKFLKKKWVIAILVVVIAIILFVALRPTPPEQFEYVQVKSSTLVNSVEGTGSVSTDSQVDLKATASGKITAILVKAGQSVRKGQTLFALDARNAQKAVRDAQTSLETAQLDLEKFKQGPKSVDVQLLEVDIAKAEKSKTDADKAIATAYRNLLNTSTVAVSTMYSDTRTPPTITGTYTGDQEATIKIYVYGTQSGQYFSSQSIPADVAGVSGTGIVSTTIPQPLGNSGLYIKFASSTDTPSLEWTITLPNKTSLNYETNLKAYNDAVDNKVQIIKDADLAIAQDKQKISDLYTPDPLDLRAKELTVRQREDALADARSNLSDYYVAAPFDGIVSTVSAQVGDMAQGGTLATIITKQKIATVLLNEVDVPNIKIGQKVDLTFDALPDLTLTGTVSEIASVGVTTSNVVNFNMKIVFDQQDERIRPGMGVTANIIISQKENVLLVPNGAIKEENNQKYVEVKNSATGLNEKVIVTTGDSNDTDTEIISGLAEGQEVVVRQIEDATPKPASPFGK